MEAAVTKKRTSKHRIKRQAQGLIRAATVAFAVLLQLAFMLSLAYFLQHYAIGIYLFMEILGILFVFMLINASESYKQFWIIIVLVLPVVGLFLYFMWGRKRTNSKTNRRFRDVDRKMHECLQSDNLILEEFQGMHPNKVQISRYLKREGFPLYKNTDVRYFPVGEKMREALFEDIRAAKSYIFLEYFIISDGVFWQELYELLKEKVKEGVEVRLLMDDFGCLIINTKQFRADLKKNGIQLAEFAPIHKDISRISFNYRNHQKITIIDGHIGYTGGINIADEYVNEIVRFGYWKDSAVRLEGDGVYSLTCFFLEMWEIAEGTDGLDYSLYKPAISVPAEGIVQPFSDGPANNPRNPAEGTYTHLINKARDYIYITTPYLVLERKMVDDLCRAAESGVDVRIITPHVYDKWYVYMVTVSNYGELIKKGVHIYEYQPGFIHAKNVIVDDEIAVCGTVNMDYRSFYLHYEDGVLMCNTDCIAAMKQDFLQTLKECREIQYAEWLHRPMRHRFMQFVLKCFSPLL